MIHAIQTLLVLAAEEFPLPWEYRKMPLDAVQNEPPADLGERTVIFLDCGNIDRMPVDFLQRDGIHIVLAGPSDLPVRVQYDCRG